jgi:hypothetical protein
MSEYAITWNTNLIPKWGGNIPPSGDDFVPKFGGCSVSNLHREERLVFVLRFS